MGPLLGWRGHRTRRVPPRWETTARGRRVLVEHTDPRVREALALRLEEHGYRVLTCPGPDRDMGVTCPVLRDATCPAVEEADAVISALDPTDPTSGALVEGIHRTRPHLPVLTGEDLHITTPPDQAGSHRFYRTTVAPLVRRLYDALVLSRSS